MKNKILVIGASSFIGQYFIKKYSNEDIIATYNNNKLKNAIKFDSLCDNLSQVIHNLNQVESAIILLGDTKPTSCIENIEKSNKLNVDSIIRILDSLKESKVKPVFISTEFVFDGNIGNYSEESDTNPIILYGKQKVCIENYIRTNFKEYLIFRLAKVYGLNKNDKTIFTNWLEFLKSNENIICAEDQRFSPIYVEDVVEVIFEFCKNKHRGLYNLGGKNSYTRLELLEIFLKVREKYTISNINIETCKFNSFDLGEDWPVDVSMNVDKLISSTKKLLMSPEEACERIMKSYQTDFV
jgi:dTDP-4-dehydrorhamnose reductase